MGGGEVNKLSARIEYAITNNNARHEYELSQRKIAGALYKSYSEKHHTRRAHRMQALTKNCQPEHIKNPLLLIFFSLRFKVIFWSTLKGHQKVG